MSQVAPTIPLAIYDAPSVGANQVGTLMPGSAATVIDATENNDGAWSEIAIPDSGAFADPMTGVLYGGAAYGWVLAPTAGGALVTIQGVAPAPSQSLAQLWVSGAQSMVQGTSLGFLAGIPSWGWLALGAAALYFLVASHRGR